MRKSSEVIDYRIKEADQLIRITDFNRHEYNRRQRGVKERSTYKVVKKFNSVCLLPI
jgi:hypothetical protein